MQGYAIVAPPPGIQSLNGSADDSAGGDIPSDSRGKVRCRGSGRGLLAAEEMREGEPGTVHTRWSRVGDPE